MQLGTPHDLSDLLATLFDVTELTRFVGRLPHGQDMLRELTLEHVSIEELAEDFARLLYRRGGATREFYGALEAERPLRVSGIRAVRKARQDEPGPNATTPSSVTRSALVAVVLGAVLTTGVAWWVGRTSSKPTQQAIQPDAPEHSSHEQAAQASADHHPLGPVKKLHPKTGSVPFPDIDLTHETTTKAIDFVTASRQTGREWLVRAPTSMRTDRIAQSIYSSTHPSKGIDGGCDYRLTSGVPGHACGHATLLGSCTLDFHELVYVEKLCMMRQVTVKPPLDEAFFEVRPLVSPLEIPKWTAPTIRRPTVTEKAGDIRRNPRLRHSDLERLHRASSDLQPAPTDE
ncbi:MAG: hypothetical protein KTR31_32675 [Myxococcales bacterium]|nr:hypothetical protein [Myxococcales bacterium]